jgi:threonine/homoserine/homoserine lactone efflux protein
MNIQHVLHIILIVYAVNLIASVVHSKRNKRSILSFSLEDILLLNIPFAGVAYLSYLALNYMLNKKNKSNT